MTFDDKCYQLALAFLNDYNLGPNERHEQAKRIAQRIQDEIEDCLFDLKGRLK